MDGYYNYMQEQELDAEVAGIKEPDPISFEERLQNVERWFARLAQYKREQEEQAFVDWFMGGNDNQGHRRAG